MPFLDSTMNSSGFLHQMLTPPGCPWPPLLTSRQAHRAKGLPGGMIASPGLSLLHEGANPYSSPCLLHILLVITQTYCIFTYRPWTLLFLAALLYPGRHLATHTAPSFSTFQGSAGCSTVYTLCLWACSTYVPPVLLLLWPPVCTCRSGDALVLCYLLG